MATGQHDRLPAHPTRKLEEGDDRSREGNRANRRAQRHLDPADRIDDKRFQTRGIDEAVKNAESARIGIGRARHQHRGDDARRAAGQHRVALHQQRGGAHRHQQPRRTQRREPPRGRRPGAQVALDHVGHRLDHVVVDPGRRVVDPGGDGEQGAVLDPLDHQPGVGGQEPTLGRAHPVAAVHRHRVEEPHAAGQLGDHLGQRHRAGQDQVDAAAAGGDGHAHQGGGARGRRAHLGAHLVSLTGGFDRTVMLLRHGARGPAPRGAGPLVVGSCSALDQPLNRDAPRWSAER